MRPVVIKLGYRDSRKNKVKIKERVKFKNVINRDITLTIGEGLLPDGTQIIKPGEKVVENGYRLERPQYGDSICFKWDIDNHTGPLTVRNGTIRVT